MSRIIVFLVSYAFSSRFRLVLPRRWIGSSALDCPYKKNSFPSNRRLANGIKNGLEASLLVRSGHRSLSLGLNSSAPPKLGGQTPLLHTWGCFGVLVIVKPRSGNRAGAMATHPTITPTRGASEASQLPDHR